jgi:hypothetical protein
MAEAFQAGGKTRRANLKRSPISRDDFALLRAPLQAGELARHEGRDIGMSRYARKVAAGAISGLHFVAGLEAS